MVQAGLSDEVVIARLKKENKAFDLSPEELIRLKKAGASDTVLRVMMDPQASLASPAPAAPIVEHGSPPKADPPQSALKLPSSVGVFVRREQGYEEVPQEMAKGRASLARMMSGGILKNKEDNYLPGGTARVQVANPRPHFLIHLPQRDVGKLEMLSVLEPRSDERVLFVVEGRVSGNIRRHMVAVELTELSPGFIEMTPKSALTPGEYAIVDYEEIKIPPRAWPFRVQ